MAHPFRSGTSVETYLAEHRAGLGGGGVTGETTTGGTGRDYSSASDALLEFWAQGGDEAALVELDRRVQAGGDGGGGGGGAEGRR